MKVNQFHRVLSVVAAVVLTGCGSGPPDAHDDHDDVEDGGHSGDIVRLTDEQLAEAGVVIAPLTGGTVATHLLLPGEIGFNLDKFVHVTPRAGGVVTEVHAFTGDEVQAGQLLAVLDSPELGEAKIGYLTALRELSQAQADAERQRTISANTESLLNLLKTDPSLEALQTQAATLRIGQDKGRLISAYAKRHAADANYDREQTLREQNLATESDLLSAQEAYNSAIAEYLSVFEDIDFRFSADLVQAEQGLRVAESAVSNADRRLHILGMSQEQIDAIESEADTAISRYELRAPVTGRIVMKHLSVGERITEAESAYSIADLSTVWLNVSVYAKYFQAISEGQTATVVADDRKASGRISYVSSAVSEATRTIIARIVLDNRDRIWRPGEFVTVQLETARGEVPLAVPIEAVQVYEGHDVIFVQDENGIEPYTVELGRRSHEMIELVSGPPVGTPIVVRNSFLIKAELGKSAAGHGH